MTTILTFFFDFFALIDTTPAILRPGTRWPTSYFILAGIELQESEGAAGFVFRDLPAVEACQNRDYIVQV